MKLYHPTIPGKTVIVKPTDAQAWVEAGWRKSAPKVRVVGEKAAERFVPKDSGTVIPKK